MLLGILKIMTMRILLLWICVILLSIHVTGQDFKKILNKSELDSINNGFKICKKIDNTNCEDFDNFQGRMNIWKIGRNFEWQFVNIASKYNINGILVSQFHFDKKGQMITYQEFTESGTLDYDCTYEYKTINGCYYRLEHQKLYYNPEKLQEEGWRFVKLQDEHGNECKYSSQHKYGKRTYYYDDGTIKTTKDYGEIK
jgi:hypothetical protein